MGFALIINPIFTMIITHYYYYFSILLLLLLLLLLLYIIIIIIIITEFPLIISVLFWDGDQEGQFLWNRPSVNPGDALTISGDGDEVELSKGPAKKTKTTSKTKNNTSFQGLKMAARNGVLGFIE